MSNTHYVGCIYFTERTAYCAIGVLNKPPESSDPILPPQVSFLAERTFDIPSAEELAPDNILTDIPKIMIEKGLDWVIDHTPDGAVEAIVVGCFGPFETLFWGVDGYGVLEDITSHDGWQGADIFGIAVRHLQYRRCRAEVRVNTEVDLAALGEFWFRGNRVIQLQDKVGRAPRREFKDNFIRDSIVVFLKVSRSINGGIAQSGDIWHGRQHPVMSVVKPRRYRIGETIDAYKGCCEVHGDCVEGLIGLEALEARTNNAFPDIPEDDILWDMIPYYVARLCVMITSILAPSRIVLGGRIILEAPNQKDMMSRVRGHFLDAIEGPFRRSPDYEEIGESAHFIQPRRTNRHPGLYGGLIRAERLLAVEGPN